jgi:transcription antitermination factor NusG
MSSSQQSWEFSSQAPVVEPDNAHWYAVHTRARHEARVVARLREQGIHTFLPLVRETHRWSDRKKTVDVPLFGCYVFVHIVPGAKERLQVCTTNGVLQIVGTKGEGVPIPDEQIQAVRLLLSEHIPYTTHPFLKIGQRVRIRGGAMDGVEGILTARNGDRTLIISVDAIQRSLAVRVEGYHVEPL